MYINMKILWEKKGPFHSSLFNQKKFKYLTYKKIQNI